LQKNLRGLYLSRAEDHTSPQKIVREFIKQAFSDGGTPSVSRVLMALLFLCSIVWITHIVWKTHALPDGGALAGLAAFAVAPYGVHRFSKQFDAESTETK
jgi:hypothetical protein